MEVQECVLYGSIISSQEELLRQRLQGLCDPGVVSFREQVTSDHFVKCWH